jgi:hypothetical protein
MQRTIDDLQTLLTGHGYACKRLLDVIVATKVATKTYKNSAGEQNLEIFLAFDQANDCVAVEILRAFDLRKAAHKEATLACLMTASAHTPLLRPALDPADGEIRLRIDCTCGSDGARDEDVLRALAILPSFADAWYEQIIAAMEKGKFDPTKVGTLNFSRMIAPPNPKPDTAGPESAPAPHDAAVPPDAAVPARAPIPPADDVTARIAALAQRPGAGRNRLRALLEFRKWLDAQPRDPGERN